MSSSTIAAQANTANRCRATEAATASADSDRTPTECHRLATITGSVVSLCRIRNTVRSVSSGFSVDIDIMGLQVTDYGADACVVTVTGEIDVVTAPDLADCLTAQLAGSQVVVVDLDGVRFLGSAGVAVLFEANELATRRGRDLQLVSHSRTANLALQVTGLGTCFTFAESVPDALNPVR
jgi:anti-sigma B factor antagonist